MKIKLKLYKIMGNLLVFVLSCCVISCSSATYYKLDEQPKDYLLMTNTGSVIREGKILLRQEGSYTIQFDSDDIVVFGTLTTRDKKSQKPFLKFFYKDYEFAASVQYQQKIENIKMLLRVNAATESGIDLDKKNRRYIDYSDVNTSSIQFKFSKIPDFTVQNIPCRVGSFLVGSDAYTIDAMLQDEWIPVYFKSKKRNPAYEIRNLSERASRVMRAGQKYAISDAQGVVVGIVHNGFYQLFDTVDQAQIHSILQTIAIMHISCDSTDVLLNTDKWY